MFIYSGGKKRRGGFIAEIEIEKIGGPSHVITTSSGGAFPVVTSTDLNTALALTPIPSTGVKDKFLSNNKGTCFRNQWGPRAWLWNGNTGNDMTFELDIPIDVLKKYCGITSQEMISAKTDVSVAMDHAEDAIRDYRDNMIIGLIVMNVITFIGVMYYRNLSNKNQKLNGFTATETDPLLI